MKKTISIILFSILFILNVQAQYLRKDNMLNFKYKFDNGFEKYDLTEVQEISKTFFTTGTPLFFMVLKNAGYNEAKRNLVQSFTAFVFDENDKNVKVFVIKNSLFSKDFQQYIFGCKAGSRIQITEVKLSIIEPNVKPDKPSKPALFNLFLK